jgi:hypothetical protein
MTKNKFYILLFIVWGVLTGFLLYAALEILYIKLLISDFSKYNLDLSLNEWGIIKCVVAAIFLLIGGLIGKKQGKFWWKKTY